VGSPSARSVSAARIDCVYDIICFLFCLVLLFGFIVGVNRLHSFLHSDILLS